MFIPFRSSRRKVVSSLPLTYSSSSLAGVGLVKILNVTPARGKMRVCFLAGRRALGDYLSLYAIAHETAGLMSTSVENLPAHVSAMQEALKQAEYELNRLRRESAVAELTGGELPVLPNGARLAARILKGDLGLIKDAASQLIKRPGTVALLGCETEPGKAAFVFARSQDVDLHMGLTATRSCHRGRHGFRWLRC